MIHYSTIKNRNQKQFLLWFRSFFSVAVYITYAHTTAAPNGRRESFAILKNCFPNGIPKIVWSPFHCTAYHKSRSAAAEEKHPQDSAVRHFSLPLTAIRAILFFSRSGIRSEAQTADIQPASGSRKPGRFSLRRIFGYQGRHKARSAALLLI